MYGILNRDAMLTSDSMEKSSAWLTGGPEVAERMSDYPADANLVLCQWDVTRGWVPAGSDE